MASKTVLQILLVLCASFCISAEGKEGKRLEETVGFDVKPSGQVTHQSIKLENGVTCVFTYAAVGGTTEEWNMNLKRIKRDSYTCTVERPDQASYLYFMNFAVSILEHDIGTVEIFDNSGALLQDEEFVLADNGKSVKDKEGGFQSNLARIVLTAKKPHVTT